MRYRLLVDLRVITSLDALPKRRRARILEHLERVRLSPEEYSDSHNFDETGRRIEISQVDEHYVHYWIDAADRHIKVLRLTLESG